VNKKDILSQIKKLNSAYNIKGSDNLLEIIENLAIDYRNEKSLKNTSKYLKNKFNIRETDLEKYAELLEKVNYFELREIFDSFENGFIPEIVFRQFEEKLEKSDARKVLITECEKHSGSIMELINKNEGVHFTLTFTNKRLYDLADYIFKDCPNTTFVNTSIYEYGFISAKFDYIFSVPVFGVRDKVKDESFISRQHDLAALENLLLHLNPNGDLFIVLTADFTFGGGEKQSLRRFILDMYNIEEISELPDKTFYPHSAVKTYLMIFTTKTLDEIVLKKYECTRFSKNSGCIAMKAVQEDLLFKSELEEKSTWNIDIINAENDEELLRYLTSQNKKVALKDYAEIFRGKAVSKKDPTGNIGVINIANIDELGIDYSGLDYIEETERKASRYLLENGDVLISSRGTILKVAIFSEQTFPCIPSSNLIVIRPNDGLLGKYLKIFLESSIGIKLLKSIQRGTTVVNINYKDLGQLEIPLLSLEEQKEIINKYEEEMNQYKTTIEVAEKRWEEAKINILERML